MRKEQSHRPAGCSKPPTITWVAPDGTDVPISLSIGVAAFPGHATELNELLAFADANLYAVKEHGRRAVSAGATPAVAGPADTASACSTA